MPTRFIVLASLLTLLSAPAQAQTEEDAPPPVLKNKRHPVFENLVVADEHVLGGWSGKGWQKVDFKKLPSQDGTLRVMVTGLTKKAAKLRLYRKNRLVAKVPVGDLLAGISEPGDPYLDAPVAKAAAFALTGDWNPFPRKPTSVEGKPFEKVASDLLKAKVPSVKRVLVLSVLALDVDNDGTDDFVIEAADKKDRGNWIAAVVYARPDGYHGEYLSITNDVAHGKVTIVDANGDGRFEFIVDTWSGSDHYINLFDLGPDGKPAEQLGYYSGD
jgi:hypothetical protein